MTRLKFKSYYNITMKKNEQMSNFWSQIFTGSWKKKLKNSESRFYNKFLGRSNHLYQNKNHLYIALYHLWINTIQNVPHHWSHIHPQPTVTSRYYRSELAFLFRYFSFSSLIASWRRVSEYFLGIENESVPYEWTILFWNHWKFFKWFKRIIFWFCQLANKR